MGFVLIEFMKSYQKIMKDKTEELRLEMIDLLCEAIKDMKEYVKGLDNRGKLKVILEFLLYVWDADKVKKALNYS